MSDPVEHIIKCVTKQVDEEIEKLCTADQDELEKIRQRRLNEMKKRQEERQGWLRKGRGVLNSIDRESDFFTLCKDNERIVIYFFTGIHLTITEMIKKKLMQLAEDHLETKFLTADIAKCSFLAKRLDVEHNSGIIVVINTKIFGPLTCETDSIAITKRFVQNLEQKLQNFNVIDINVDKEEREAMAKGLKYTMKKKIRDMDSEFLAQIANDDLFN